MTSNIPRIRLPLGEGNSIHISRPYLWIYLHLEFWNVEGRERGTSFRSAAQKVFDTWKFDLGLLHTSFVIYLLLKI